MDGPPLPTPLPAPIRLAAAGITKSFDGRTALADVGFSVTAGEVVAVLGPSGAGKTTLFRCLTGLVAPDAGQVRVDGDDITRLRGRARRRVGVVFQQFNLVGRLTALDNVLAGRLGHVPAWRGWLRRFERADRLLALECLDRVGLLAHAGQRADRLSGGQQQRVAIARALAQRPSLIVADEPVASLDPATGAGVLDLLRGIARAPQGNDGGVSVVCSLHQVDFARAFADRVVGLRDGRVLVDVPTARFDTDAYTRLYGGT
ncbi:phosphonate ABC transporter ATP-binding protein [Azospirillum sp. B4]|uniref:phosphonate ABC transporter ATP-binding protein n=1 Tax=Azospirillum sp. B4 TaxID=95605 RepID=UPI00034C3AEE|nr:phosphonate ABC transporter ATP-binding protein [Azospirillum sp. B4]